MNLECKKERGALTFSFSGDIDEFSCRTLRSEIDGTIAECAPREVVFDMKTCLSWTARASVLFSEDTSG